jgi:hypothetical protein
MGYGIQSLDTTHVTHKNIRIGKKFKEKSNLMELVSW